MLKQVFSFFDMGGYGIYIWPCYALLLAIVSWQIFLALKRNMTMYNKVKDNVWLGIDSDKQT